jgi:predicted permease
MSWRRFLRRTWWDGERARELESYLQIETDENIARGMSAEDARRAAHRKLGNTVRIREEIYEMNTIEMLESVGRDLRYAARGMMRRPGFTLAVVLTLALGIGANTAIFSVVNAVLIKPLRYPNPQGLVSIHHAAPGLPAGEVSLSPSMYYTYEDESRAFQHIGVWGHGGRTLTGHGDPEQVRALFTTFDVLPALGVQPMLGRLFNRADAAPDTPVADPVILTYPYWQRRFGGDRSVVGRRLMMDAQAAEIVGVMPQGFRFLDLKPEIEAIAMIRFNRAQTALAEFGNLQGLARLKPGLTLADANADVARMLPIWLDAWPAARGTLGREAIANWRLAPALRPLKDDVVGNVSQLTVVGNVPDMLWVVMGTLGLVLLIACANIANLMLVRSDGRRHEFAVRAALGAGRRRIAREVLVESLALGAVGGALGMVVAYGALELLVAIAPANLPRVSEISLDSRVFAFAAAVSLLCSLVCGFLPALRQASNADAPMPAATRAVSTSRERQRTRNALVVVQVALALVLLVSSGLMLRTFQALQNVDPGFTRAEELQTMRLWIPPSRIREPERFTRTQHEIVDRIAALPGVTAAGFASAIPMEGRFNDDRVIVEGESYAANETPPRRRADDCRSRYHVERYLCAHAGGGDLGEFRARRVAHTRCRLGETHSRIGPR